MRILIVSYYFPPYNTIGAVLEKAHKKQIRIAETEKYPHVTFFFSGGREVPFAGEQRIMGLMVESHLVEGRQDLVAGQSLTFGQSITDACLGWDHSVALLDQLAQAVRARRQHASTS